MAKSDQKSWLWEVADQLNYHVSEATEHSETGSGTQEAGRRQQEAGSRQQAIGEMMKKVSLLPRKRNTALMVRITTPLLNLLQGKNHVMKKVEEKVMVKAEKKVVVVEEEEEKKMVVKVMSADFLHIMSQKISLFVDLSVNWVRCR